MLQNNLELIVQYPEQDGYSCRGFSGLHLRAPAYVVFDGAQLADQSVANLLGAEFCGEMLRYTGAREESLMPCNGRRAIVACHALDELTCRKVLVRPAATLNTPAAGRWPTPSAEALWLSKWGPDTWKVILPMRQGTKAELHLPDEWKTINASFWKLHPAETLMGVMQQVGLAPEEGRLFISYVRRDTAPVAEQLFQALTEEGFDVFLDRYSVPVGVQFQERLMQDLSDKAMVVLLNSEHVAEGPDHSAWVEAELTNIKLYKLGLLELRFPGGKKRADLDPEFTDELDSPGDFEPSGPYVAETSKLSPAKLADVVQQIKLVHGRALYRRRYLLIDNFAAALMKAGRSGKLLADGSFHLPATASKSEAVVSLIARPPELGDFCGLHRRGCVSTSRAGWLISPAPFYLAQRQAQVAWLGGICNIQHADQAQIMQLAQKI